MKCLLLLLALAFQLHASEAIGVDSFKTKAGSMIEVYGWTDPGTDRSYLIFFTLSGEARIVVTERLPAVPTPVHFPSTVKIEQDGTYEYAITLTSWNPVNGWERIAPFGDGSMARYRRSLTWQPSTMVEK